MTTASQGIEAPFLYANYPDNDKNIKRTLDFSA